ncbi:hypothetical protein AGMMS49579_16150 [Spirochaetia bacterium]|nr:hypothetical protein AGMMS49579_16150 [Spirochaetia bacterium]
MKNGKMILGGMAVLLLAFGLVFTACDTGGGSGGSGGTSGDNSTKFEGTWTASWGNATNGTSTYVFSGSTYTDTKTAGTGDTNSWTRSGTFTYTDTQITFTRTSPSAGEMVKSYTLVGDSLNLVSISGGGNQGTYTKQ